ncbi:MAG: hypothetical protein KUG68_10540, partial [Flavobacteriaceae bacterium]|nr:hypothetical protein [Flavobacteriaceae bacterium]
MIQNIEVTDNFKKMTKKAILSIVLFVIIYLLILSISIAITLFCFYSGFLIITIKPSLLLIVLGGGIVSLGLILIIFLLKFMFKKHKMDRSHLIEITRKDEPQLFNFIDGI